MRGYTLMELMVTVALLALMSAMTAVGLQPLQTRYRLRKATDATAALLVRTRQRAIETGRCHQIEVLVEGSPVTDLPGDVIRVSRRRDVDCESPADPLGLVEVERLTLPERMTARQEGSQVLVYRPTGRTWDNEPHRFRVGRDTSLRIVVAVPQGPVCTLEDETEGCP